MLPNCLLRTGVSGLQEAMIRHMETERKTCFEESCNEESTPDFLVGDVLLLDTEFLQSPLQDRSRLAKSFSLGDFPSTLRIGQSAPTYVLAGIVAQTPGHYIGYAGSQEAGRSITTRAGNRTPWRAQQRLHHT